MTSYLDYLDNADNLTPLSFVRELGNRLDYPIFPRDLEIILMKHPAVKETFVTGDQSEDSSIGQIPVAYVVVKDEYRGKVSEKELIDFVNSKVAFYKKLRKVYLVDKLPIK